MADNSFSESKKNFGRLKKRETFQPKKTKIWAVKNIFAPDFAKYLSYSDVPKNSKVANV